MTKLLAAQAADDEAGEQVRVPAEPRIRSLTGTIGDKETATRRPPLKVHM